MAHIVMQRNDSTDEIMCGIKKGVFIYLISTTYHIREMNVVEVTKRYYLNTQIKTKEQNVMNVKIMVDKQCLAG